MTKKDMIYRDIDGLQVSKIILGSAYFGAEISRGLAEKMMEKYVELGGNAIDTSMFYGTWEADKCTAIDIVGEYMRYKSHRKKYVLIAKTGLPTVDMDLFPRLSRREIFDDVEEMLSRLNVDCIDILILVRDGENYEVGYILETLNDLIKMGKVQRLGVMGWSMARIREANAYAKANGLIGFSVCEAEYSAAVPNAQAFSSTLFPFLSEGDKRELTEMGMTIFAGSSQAAGLFGAVEKFGDYYKDKLRDEVARKYLCPQTDAVLLELKNESRKLGCSYNIAALLRLLREENIHPMISARDLLQLEDSMSAVSWLK